MSEACEWIVVPTSRYINKAMPQCNNELLPWIKEMHDFKHCPYCGKPIHHIQEKEQ